MEMVVDSECCSMHGMNVRRVTTRSFAIGRQDGPIAILGRVKLPSKVVVRSILAREKLSRIERKFFST